MGKFKAGDRVRVLDRDDIGPNFRGKVGTVIRTTYKGTPLDGPDVQLDSDDGPLGFFDWELEYE